MKEMILTFELGKESGRAVNQVCRQLGMEKKRILPGDYIHPLGYLAELEDFPAGAGNGSRQTGNALKDMEQEAEELHGEMLVFCGINSRRLDAFLTAYRNTGAESIGLKAMLTPHNVWWDVRQLYRELLREHTEMCRK